MQLAMVLKWACRWRLALISGVVANGIVGAPTMLQAGGEPDANFWDWREAGRITHRLQKNEASMVLCMQGRQVVMEAHVNQVEGLKYQARFFGVRDPQQKNQLVFRGGSESLPVVTCNEQSYAFGHPLAVTFDGKLTMLYAAHDGVEARRVVFPSADKALVIEQWELKNLTNLPIAIEVAAGHKLGVSVAQAVTVMDSPALKEKVAAGEVLRFCISVQAHAVDAPDLKVDAVVEGNARQSLAHAAWDGPGRLEVPDSMLVAAYALQKLHVLETPIRTGKGLITHNGSLTYTPGVWANDPVEYSSPLFPFFGDKVLNEAAMNMYRIWLNHCQEHGFDPFPGSFEHEALKLTQRDRGDDAMVLYGLSKFLLFQGDRKAAEEMWPLLEFSAASIEKHMTSDGVVGSKTDEMEGRYPTGAVNLSTSSLAYGGYIHAARVARELGKEEIARLYEAKAAQLAVAIEKYFGAEVEGFATYRYFKDNTVLRGWILLPLAMGIREREQGTVAALLSDRLWPERQRGGDLLAASNRQTEWGRETYYALRVLFKAGKTDEALDLSRKVVQAQIFGAKGPYPDEDAIDMLCPGSLYPRVFTEGMFEISPLGFGSFQCTPHLPATWPKMALRDMRAFGCSWDLVVQRDGTQQKVTVTREGKTVFAGSGSVGKTYVVDLQR